MQGRGRKGQRHVKSAATSQIGAPVRDNWNTDLNSVCSSTVHAFSFWKLLFGGKCWPSFFKGSGRGLSGCVGKGRASSSLWKRGFSRAGVATSWSPRSCCGVLSSPSTAPFLKEFFLSHFIFIGESKAELCASSRLAEAPLQPAGSLPSLYLVGWICFTCI